MVKGLVMEFMDEFFTREKLSKEMRASFVVLVANDRLVSIRDYWFIFFFER